MQQQTFTDGHKNMDTRETDFYRLSMAREAKALSGPPKGSEHRNPVLGGTTPRKFRTSPGLLRSNGAVEWRAEENPVVPTFADRTAISPTKRVNFQPVAALSSQKQPRAISRPTCILCASRCGMPCVRMHLHLRCCRDASIC